MKKPSILLRIKENVKLRISVAVQTDVIECFQLFDMIIFTLCCIFVRNMHVIVQDGKANVFQFKLIVMKLRQTRFIRIHIIFGYILIIQKIIIDCRKSFSMSLGTSRKFQKALKILPEPSRS